MLHNLLESCSLQAQPEMLPQAQYQAWACYAISPSRIVKAAAYYLAAAEALVLPSWLGLQLDAVEAQRICADSHAKT